jgi:hypothetical protein
MMYLPQIILFAGGRLPEGFGWRRFAATIEEGCEGSTGMAGAYLPVTNMVITLNAGEPACWRDFRKLTKSSSPRLFWASCSTGDFGKLVRRVVQSVSQFCKLDFIQLTTLDMHLKDQH